MQKNKNEKKNLYASSNSDFANVNPLTNFPIASDQSTFQLKMAKIASCKTTKPK